MKKEELLLIAEEVLAKLNRLNRANKFAEDVTDINKCNFIYNEVQDFLGGIGYSVNPKIYNNRMKKEGGGRF